MSVEERFDQNADKYYTSQKKERIKVVKNYRNAFHSETLNVLDKFIPDIKGKKVCIPSSGDNVAAVAFAMMGAEVTSCDISQKQLGNAKKWIDELNLDIRLIKQDTMKLEALADEQFDLVFTSNGVHVWIYDLDAMYRNINRILKRGGLYIMREVHPFMRPFEDDILNLKIKKPYSDIGPYKTDDGYESCYETFHYKLENIINAISGNNLTIMKMKECEDEYNTSMFDEEFYPNQGLKKEDIYNWKTNKLFALLSWLILCAEKR